MQRTTYPLITPPKGDLCSIDWVMETPQLQAAVQRQPDLGQRFLTSFATSALLGGLGELFEQTGLVSFDISALAGASGGQLSDLLTIANGWDPARSLAGCNRNLYTPENKSTPRGRSVGPFARSLEKALHHFGHAEARDGIRDHHLGVLIAGHPVALDKAAVQMGRRFGWPGPHVFIEPAADCSQGIGAQFFVQLGWMEEQLQPL